MSLHLKKHFKEIIPNLSDEDFEYIVSHYTYIARKKHQFVVQAGDVVNHDYWVINGCLKAYFVDDAGKEHIIQFAMENWWITDYNAFHNRIPSTIYITCIEDCELLSISLENQEKLCREFHSMEHFSSTKAKKGYIALQKRILSLLKNSAAERYEQLREQYPQLFQRVPKKMIAAYLGVSRETLTRLHSETKK